MSLPAHAASWMDGAKVDYIGPFVKAWAAFNAWYRTASSEKNERSMLEYVKNQPNRARRHVLPLLDNENQTAASLSLKQAICDLHQCLDNIHFEVSRKNVVERISLRSVCIKSKPLDTERMEKRGLQYQAKRTHGGAIQVTVTSLRKNQVKFQHSQKEYDAAEIYSLPNFTKDLSPTQRDSLRTFYDTCNPRPMQDLVKGAGPELSVASMQFHCSGQELLSGLVETIYAMRNALLHGEVDPDSNVLRCYEPAYRIVMQILTCIR